jgi:hypothetical protein
VIQQNIVGTVRLNGNDTKRQHQRRQRDGQTRLQTLGNALFLHPRQHRGLVGLHIVGQAAAKSDAAVGQPVDPFGAVGEPFVHFSDQLTGFAKVHCAQAQQKICHHFLRSAAKKLRRKVVTFCNIFANRREYNIETAYLSSFCPFGNFYTGKWKKEAAFSFSLAYGGGFRYNNGEKQKRRTAYARRIYPRRADRQCPWYQR